MEKLGSQVNDLFDAYEARGHKIEKLVNSIYEVVAHLQDDSQPTMLEEVIEALKGDLPGNLVNRLEDKRNSH